MDVRVIGVDCATEASKTGLALGHWNEGGLGVEFAGVAANDRPAVSIIADWLGPAGRPILIALDAPLGWPTPLSEVLITHCAGRPLSVPANQMFRRSTDRFIQKKIGKTPLDVGADRIARTAHAAPTLLTAIENRVEGSIPLAWNPASLLPTSAIEVYPVATLRSHGFSDGGYKRPDERAKRLAILECLRSIAVLPEDLAAPIHSADSLDAILCLVAASDFLSGKAMAPSDTELAKKEGWIWVRDPLFRS